MSTNAEQAEAAKALAKTITDLQTKATENGTALTDIGAKMATVQSQMLALQQAQNAAVRAAQEAQYGTNRELESYVRRADSAPPESELAEKRWVKTDKGSIRLLSTVERHIHSGEVIDQHQWGLLDDPNPKSKAQENLQRVMTLRSICVGLAKHNRAGAGARIPSPVLDAMVLDAARACGGEVEKIFSNSTGIGAEFLPRNTIPTVERDILVPTNLSSIVRTVQLAPGTNYIPKVSGKARWYIGAIPTTDDPANATLSSITTAENTLSSKPFACAMQVDRDTDADSLIPIANELQLAMVNAGRFMLDDSMVNGDTNATHQDAIASWNTRSQLGSSGLGTTADHRRSCLGLRARAFDLTSMTTDQNSAQTFDGMRTACAKLGVDNLIGGYNTNGNIVILVSWEYFFSKMLGWSEFQSFTQVGASASLLTGTLGQGPALLPMQVGWLFGMIPVCIAYPLTADLAATGLYTGSGSTTGAIQFDRSRARRIVRQGMTVESATEIRNNTVTYVARMRALPMDWQDAVSSSIKDVHYSFNLTY